MQKCPKSFPKVSKHVLNMFWVNFFKKNFCPVFHEGRVFENFQKNQKTFKIPKMPTIVPKSVQTCFEYVLGRFFRNSFFVQCSLEGRVVENFQKNKKFSKFQKCPKSLSKVSKRVLNMFRVNFFENFFRPVFHGGSSLRKFSNKSKFF